MKILIINSAPHTGEFVQPIANILAGAGFLPKRVAYDNIPTNLDSYAGVIIGASPQGDDIVAAHIPYYQWIKSTHIPILGICHGHQLIGVIHGAKLIRGTQSGNEEYSVSIKESNPLFAGCGARFTVEQHHNDSITLPDEFILLASSERCLVQAMVHQAKPIYTVQFHAEKNPEIILNFAEIALQGPYV